MSALTVHELHTGDEVEHLGWFASLSVGGQAGHLGGASHEFQDADAYPSEYYVRIHQQRHAPPTADEALREWWVRTMTADFDAMAPKIGEYSAADLDIMGTVMERWELSAPKGGSEAACLWYILGKVARAVSAYREGRQPSEDTLHDIVVYAMMARRIRQTGEWP